MQRSAVPFAMIYLTLGLTPASSWGQIPKNLQFESLAHAEDSLETAADNQLFYNSPHTPSPQISQPASTVSVEQLQHPLSRKGASLIRQAQNFAAMGDHEKAIEKLQVALKERTAMPYAQSMLGSEYLKIQEVPEAIEALEQAVKLMPHSVVNHSNLGYAWFCLGDLDRGEEEARRALELDRNNQKTRHVLSLITNARENAR
jgi:tetratricopeptide (TPR) repeat protein